jgi:hypothetical protein
MISSYISGTMEKLAVAAIMNKTKDLESNCAICHLPLYGALTLKISHRRHREEVFSSSLLFPSSFSVSFYF